MSDKSQIATPPTVIMSNEQFNQLIRGLAASSGASNNRNGPTKGWFRPQDLGYFDPNNETDQFVEFVDNKTKNHNVYSFTTRVKAKSVGVTEGPFASTIVATQLDQCLKGKAELWYTYEISNTTRARLKASIENWCTELETRFRMSPGVALEKLEKPKYTISDVRRRQDPEEFVQNIVVLGKSADIAETEYSQILTAHRHFAAELRIHIPAPTTDINLTTFIKQIG
ncbi:hypothetical protein OnM2_034065 [Erysiphe neolycopersici]|uniref:Uncharacterized protein n=1 Tax=Erysiphe neolycopersici TaxID=212602 RepID=A0A420HY76_9PEZI|nr:hypothetical protein OnM2_034065 [Erysiphe neolycopersici]